MVDRVADGRAFRILTVVDQYTRECPLLLMDRSLTAKNVVEALDQVIGLLQGFQTTGQQTELGC